MSITEPYPELSELLASMGAAGTRIGHAGRHGETADEAGPRDAASPSPLSRFQRSCAGTDRARGRYPCRPPSLVTNGVGHQEQHLATGP